MKVEAVEILEVTGGWLVKIPDVAEEVYPTGVEALRAVNRHAEQRVMETGISLATTIEWTTTTSIGRSVARVLAGQVK